jgi:hypothetical protein
MKIELVSNAQVVEEAIDLAERYRDVTSFSEEKVKVTIDNGIH